MLIELKDISTSHLRKYRNMKEILDKYGITDYQKLQYAMRYSEIKNNQVLVAALSHILQINALNSDLEEALLKKENNIEIEEQNLIFQVNRNVPADRLPFFTFQSKLGEAYHDCSVADLQKMCENYVYFKYAPSELTKLYPDKMVPEIIIGGIKYTQFQTNCGKNIGIKRYYQLMDSIHFHNQYVQQLLKRGITECPIENLFEYGQDNKKKRILCNQLKIYRYLMTQNTSFIFGNFSKPRCEKILTYIENGCQPIFENNGAKNQVTKINQVLVDYLLPEEIEKEKALTKFFLPNQK